MFALITLLLVLLFGGMAGLFVIDRVAPGGWVAGVISVCWLVLIWLVAVAVVTISSRPG